MNSHTLRGLACALVLLALDATNQAHAGLLTISDASDLAQSTATDLDVFLLGAMNGFHYQTVNYGSTSKTAGWSGSLTGAYGPSNLNVSYTGNLTSYPSGGPVTWSSTGTYGASQWSGGGSATITDTSATTFQMNLSANLAVGTNNASINYVVPGTMLPDGTEMLGTPTNPEAGTGTMFVNAMAMAGPRFSWYKTPRWLPNILSDIFYNGIPRPIPPFIYVDNYENLTSAPPPPNGQFVMAETIATSASPEPSCLALLGTGVLSLLGYGWGRRKQAVA
jgi:hypothetical protein